MDVVVAIFADFEQTFLGGPSQLSEPLAGAPTMVHTLRRVSRVTGVGRRCVMVRPRDEAAARGMVSAAGLEGAFEVLAIDDGARPRRGLIRSARKWHLDGWRGTPLGTTWYDEYIEPLAVGRVLDHYRCDAVLCVDGHQAVFDPAWADGALRYLGSNSEEAGFVFSPAPPGLTGIIVGRQTAAELLREDMPIGLLLSFRPERCRGDAITQSMCYQIGTAVTQTSGRFMGDTRRGREVVAAGLTACGEEASAEALCGWWNAHRDLHPEALPVEVELELTTRRPFEPPALYPRMRDVSARHLSDLGAVSALAEELAAYDDRRVILGGHGDPLCHEAFPEVVRRLREGGVCGIGVATWLYDVSDAAFEALFEHEVDVVEVRLNANSSGTYAAVHGVDGFEQVLGNMERIEKARRARVSPPPLLIPSLIRSEATLEEMESFFDRWIRSVGSAVIRRYSDYGGLLASDGLLKSVSESAEVCCGMGETPVFLADGGVVIGGEDYAGMGPIGDWLSEPIGKWFGTCDFTRTCGAHVGVCG